MNLKAIKIAVLVILFTSCNKKQNSKFSTKENNFDVKEVIKAKDINSLIIEEKHCYVIDILDNNGKELLVVDYVDFLFDDEAFEKAKEENDLDYEVSENGDTIFSLYNDYYISNTNLKLRTLEIYPKVKIELWNYPVNNGKYNDVTISEFKSHLINNPVMILKIENGIIIEMKEQYVP